MKNLLFDESSVGHFSLAEVRQTSMDGMAEINQYYDKSLNTLYEIKRQPIVMRPPLQWAQNLHFIFLEVKYAYRHDVAGCATLHDERIELNDNHLSIEAFCREQDNFLRFNVDFPLWADVNVTSLEWEY